MSSPLCQVCVLFLHIASESCHWINKGSEEISWPAEFSDGGVNLGPETKDKMTTIIISESNLCRVVRPEAATENTTVKLKV